MKALTRKYLFLPLIVLFCGVYQVSPRNAGYDAPRFSSSADQQSHKAKYFSKENYPKSCEKSAYEIVEQTSDTFQKDLAGDSSFGWLAFKDYTYSVLHLLSERLSLHKPLSVTHSHQAIYLVIRILRL